MFVIAFFNLSHLSMVFLFIIIIIIIVIIIIIHTFFSFLCLPSIHSLSAPYYPQRLSLYLSLITFQYTSLPFGLLDTGLTLPNLPKHVCPVHRFRRDTLYERCLPRFLSHPYRKGLQDDHRVSNIHRFTLEFYSYS